MCFMVIGVLVFCLMLVVCESGDGGDFGQVFGDVFGEIGSGDMFGGELIVFEIDVGLCQVLEIGIECVVDQIGVVDGYWQDLQIKIFLLG